MMRSFLVAIFIFISAMEAHAEMSTEARRDFILACLGSGALKIEGKEPTGPESDSIADINRFINSYIESLPLTDDKISVHREIIACVQKVIDASGYNKRESRVEPRGANPYVEIALINNPLDYAIATMCRYPDIRIYFLLGKTLLQNQSNADAAQESLISLLAQEMNTDEQVIRAIYNTDVAKLNCSVERICEVRGSVPVDVLTDTLFVFDISMRQVYVKAGRCEGKTGFVNENFLTF